VKPDDDNERATVQGLVERHRVTFHVYPEQHVQAGELVQIGYALELEGRHAVPRHPPEPGCDECAIVFSALGRVARWAAPQEAREERSTDFVIEPFRPHLTYDPSDLHAKVVLVAKIVHRFDYSAQIDDCERRCCAEVEARLTAIGARSA